MNANNQHGRRRADKNYKDTNVNASTVVSGDRQRGRRRAETPSVPWFMSTPVKSVGASFAACAVLLTLTTPVLDDTRMTEASQNSVTRSVISSVSLASVRTPTVVTADADAKVSFERQGVTSKQDLELKLKKKVEEQKAKEAKEKEEADKANPAPPAGAVVGRDTTQRFNAASSVQAESNETLSAPLLTLVEASAFGKRINPITGETGEEHTGQDFAAQCGTEVLSSAKGTVVYTQWHPYGGGNRIEVDHGNGLVTSYNHLESSSVKIGQVVERGVVIGKVGTTGASTGCHLHFEVLVDNVKVDPKGWLS